MAEKTTPRPGDLWEDDPDVDWDDNDFEWDTFNGEVKVLTVTDKWISFLDLAGEENDPDEDNTHEEELKHFVLMMRPVMEI